MVVVAAAVVVTIAVKVSMAALPEVIWMEDISKGMIIRENRKKSVTRSSRLLVCRSSRCSHGWRIGRMTMELRGRGRRDDGRTSSSSRTVYSGGEWMGMKTCSKRLPHKEGEEKENRKRMDQETGGREREPCQQGQRRGRVLERSDPRH